MHAHARTNYSCSCRYVCQMAVMAENNVYMCGIERYLRVIRHVILYLC